MYFTLLLVPNINCVLHVHVFSFVSYWILHEFFGISVTLFNAYYEYDIVKDFLVELFIVSF